MSAVVAQPKRVLVSLAVATVALFVASGVLDTADHGTVYVLGGIAWCASVAAFAGFLAIGTAALVHQHRSAS